MFLFSPVIRIFWEGRWQGGFVEPRRRLYDCELVYTSAGEFQLDIAGITHQMRAGSAAIIPAGIWHESRVPSAGFAVRHCIHFEWLPEAARRPRPIANYPGEPYDAKVISLVPPEIARHLPLVAHGDACADVGEIIHDASRHFRQGDVIGQSMLWPVLNLLLAACSTVESSVPSTAPSAHAVLRIRDFIDANFTSPQSYATYRQLSGLSTSHLCQRFSSVFGRPPFSYLLNLRLQHALRLLRESDRSIKEVAHAVGMRDPNYFSRLFRKRFGQSPSEFQSTALHRG